MHLVTVSGLPVQLACQAVGRSRATYFRPLVQWAQRDGLGIEALTALNASNPRWGFWKYVGLLRNTGQQWNHKRLWRVYCRLRLNVPRRTKKRVPVRVVQPLAVSPQPNVGWAVDFMRDPLYGGRRFRTFNLLDEGVREVLAIDVDTALPTERVIRVLEPVTAWRGHPQTIRLDNGPEFLADRLAGGVRTAAWPCAISTQASRISMPWWNGSIAHSVMKCWTPTCSSRWIKCAKSVRSGCESKTKSVPMTH
jgi:putative transposase